MLPELSDKDVNIEDIVEKALAAVGILFELLGLKLKVETIRYN